MAGQGSGLGCRLLGKNPPKADKHYALRAMRSAQIKEDIMYTVIIILAVVLIVLNIMDVKTTLEALELGGREANPVARWIMEKLGVKRGLIVSKAVVVLPIAGFFIYIHNSASVVSLIILDVIYGLVVKNNIDKLSKLSKR